MRDALARLLRGSWLRQGAWTVTDQALFAGANFVVNVLLARWLAPEAYGAFSVAFVVFLLAGTVHNGLIIEPMLVFGPGRFEGRTGAYLRVLLRAHAGYALVAGAGLAAIGGIAWVTSGPLMGGLFLTLAVAQAAILCGWLLRRACYVVSRPDWAAAAGGVYLVLLIAGAVGLAEAGWLTGATALGTMAGASLAAVVFLAVKLGVPLRAERSGLAAEAREAHATYGRWSAPTGVVEWAQSALPYLALPFFVGLAGSGELRAMMNLVMPALMGFAALSTLCLPVFVRARAEGSLRSTTTSVGAAFVGLAAVYGVLTLVFGRWAMDVLYDGNYAVSTASLVLLALLPLVASVANLLTALVRSVEQPAVVFRGRIAAVGVSATAGLGATAVLGVAGALVSDLLVLVTEIGALGPAGREALDASPSETAAGETDDDPSREPAEAPARTLHPTPVPA